MWCCRALFGPEPKPRQARDGHSWRMAAALLVLPAGPSPLLPALWWCVEGRGAVIRSEPSLPPRTLHLFVWGSVYPRRGVSRCPRGIRRAVWPSFPGRRKGLADSLRHTLFPNGCACASPRWRPSLVLLERSRLNLKRCPILSGRVVSRSPALSPDARSGLALSVGAVLLCLAPFSDVPLGFFGRGKENKKGVESGKGEKALFALCPVVVWRFLFCVGDPPPPRGSSSKGERPPRRTRLPSPVGLGASGGAERSRAGLLPLALINDARRLVGKKRPGLRGGPVLAPVPPVRECSRYVPRKKKAKALPKPQTPTLRLSVCSLDDRVVALQHAHTPAAVGQPRLGPRRVGSVPPSVRKMPSLAIRGRGGRTVIVSGAPLSRVGPLTYRLPRPDRPFACSRVPPRARVLWGGTRASSRALSLFPVSYTHLTLPTT